MPELPEVENVRRTLKSLILGKEIKEIQVHYPKIINGNAHEFVKKITGQTIRQVERVGKFLVFILDDIAFVSHLRMEGKYNYYPKEKLVDTELTKKQLIDKQLTDKQFADKHNHLTIIFSDASRLCYNDVRKFGRLQLVDKVNYIHQQPLCSLGPEPKDANVDILYSKISKSSLPIKALLLDQSIIAGIGNIYANEICFELGVDPRTPSKNLSKNRVSQLIDVSARILEHSIQEGGTTIHSFASDGESGNYQSFLKVHMRSTCPTCGGDITKEKVKGRGTYFCRNCQSKKR